MSKWLVFLLARAFARAGRAARDRPSAIASCPSRPARALVRFARPFLLAALSGCGVLTGGSTGSSASDVPEMYGPWARSMPYWYGTAAYPYDFYAWPYDRADTSAYTPYAYGLRQPTVEVPEIDDEDEENEERAERELEARERASPGV